MLHELMVIERKFFKNNISCLPNENQQYLGIFLGFFQDCLDIEFIKNVITYKKTRIKKNSLTQSINKK